MNEQLLILNNYESSNNELVGLRQRGDCFELETGERFTVAECTDFRLFEKFIRDVDISSVVEQRQSLGFNTHRVFGSCHNMFRFYPYEISNYYLKLGQFIDYMARKGQRVEFTAFVDATKAIPHSQVVHWNTIGEVLENKPNVMLELVNENNHPTGINRINTDAFSKLNNIICSRGSNGSQQDPVRPWWDYEVTHWNDAPEWQRKVGHNSMEYYHGAETIVASKKPIIANENTRPDKDNNIQHFEDGAAGATLLCAGACFHCDQGRDSVLFTGQNLEFARAWIKGVKSINLEARGKPYIHRRDLEEIDPITNKPTKFLRVYQKGFEERPDHMVFIRF